MDSLRGWGGVWGGWGGMGWVWGGGIILELSNKGLGAGYILYRLTPTPSIEGTFTSSSSLTGKINRTDFLFANFSSGGNGYN